MHHHADWGILYLSTAPEERGGGEVRRRENIEKGKNGREEWREEREQRIEEERRREGRREKEGRGREESGKTEDGTCTMVEAGLSLYLMVTGMRLLQSLCITDVSFNSVRTGRPG